MTPHPTPFAVSPNPAENGWAARSAWCVLHTAFDGGAHFLRTWAAWRADPQRPRMLHYVALAALEPGLKALSSESSHPSMAAMVEALSAQWIGLTPGQHRLCFEGGQVLLTLCVGPRLLVLRQQQFEADRVVLAPILATEAPWDEWDTKALVRCCRRGTQLVVLDPQSDAPQWLRQCGCEFADQDPRTTTLHGVFNPRWALKTTREPWRNAHAEPQSCAVIGAGIAGASVAASLARRGWQVQVFDQASAPAAGASALPVGLAAPHVSIDDCVLSRLSRMGVRLSLQQAATLLVEGHDWAPSGVYEHRFDDSAAQPLPARWHPDAGWIKPAALVHAWLRHNNVTFHGGVMVHDLRRGDSGWTLLDCEGHVITTVARVVLANAGGALPLLRKAQGSQSTLAWGSHQLPAVYGVRGQVSWAVHDAPEERPFPAGPVNGNGSLIPFVPFEGEQRWFVGASYQPMGKPEWPDDKNHGANVLRLEKLLPTLSEALAPVFEAGALHAWKGVRCVTADRLPMLGSVLQDDPSLWICAGMGSRGLSYAPLCAELLAAQWAGEPLPIEAALAQSMNARRHRAHSTP
jgi:tRNA 5-methylaminomethyl-2-thiouridine biosynthesis bifunctional protein